MPRIAPLGTFRSFHGVMATSLNNTTKGVLHLFRQVPEHFTGGFLGSEMKRIVVAVTVKFQMKRELLEINLRIGESPRPDLHQSGLNLARHFSELGIRKG